MATTLYEKGVLTEGLIAIPAQKEMELKTSNPDIVARKGVVFHLPENLEDYAVENGTKLPEGTVAYQMSIGVKDFGSEDLIGRIKILRVPNDLDESLTHVEYLEDDLTPYILRLELDNLTRDQLKSTSWFLLHRGKRFEAETDQDNDELKRNGHESLIFIGTWRDQNDNSLHLPLPKSKLGVPSFIIDEKTDDLDL